MAYCPNAIGGTATVRADDVYLALRGDLTINIDEFERTGVGGMDRVHGFTQSPHIPTISGTFSDNGRLSLKALRRICNATVQADLVNGKSYLLRNAWTAAAIDLNADEGSFSLEFQGMSGEELLA
ncbi:MAG: phage tail tube protein [Alphaproteobacteria bacterium]|nr:phage tail tube protein [Alphaproteobacteria bacterium]